jgi:hypothetical protein
MGRPARLEQITIALTPELRAFVNREAERESRTVAGQIRHLVVEAYRRAGSPPPSNHSPPPALPNVDSKPESIADARGRIAELKNEQLRLQRKRRARDSSAADDAILDALPGKIRFVEDQVAMAERMMAPGPGGVK